MSADQHVQIELPSRRRRGRPALPKFLAVDFFCGAGGTTRGLIDAGGYVIAGVDKDERCRRTYVANNGNEYLDRDYVRFLSRDVFPRSNDHPTGERRLLYKELDVLIEEYREKAPRAFLLFAICAPCQPFTGLARAPMSKERLARREQDKGLLRAACAYVSRYRPEVILSENVAGISADRYGGVWDDFRGRLDRLGYATGTNVVCTSNFGIPQYRKRSILVAVRRDRLNKRYCADLHGCEVQVPVKDTEANMMSVFKAINHLPPLEAGARTSTIPNHVTRGMSELNRKRLSYAKPGETNAYLLTTPEGDLSLPCHERVNARLKDRCFGDVYTRMHPDRPSPTITTKCHSVTNGRFGHYDTAQTRGISLREAAALQTFPDDYVFHPLHQVEPVARMIGNAVPPKLARFYAEYLTEAIE